MPLQVTLVGKMMPSEDDDVCRPEHVVLKSFPLSAGHKLGVQIITNTILGFLSLL